MTSNVLGGGEGTVYIDALATDTSVYSRVGIDGVFIHCRRSVSITRDGDNT